MAYETIAVKHLAPGDRIYNRFAIYPESRWIRIRSTRPTDNGKRITIVTTAWTTWKRPEESIAVQRRK
jgi:hypothetical protein